MSNERGVALEKELELFFEKFLEKTRPKVEVASSKLWVDIEISELAFDSLDLTMLSLDIEESFGVILAPSEIISAGTFSQLMVLLNERL